MKEEQEVETVKTKGRKPEVKQPISTEGQIPTEQGEQVTVSIPERDETGEVVFIDDVIQRRYVTVAKDLAEEQIGKWSEFERAYNKDKNTKVEKGNPHWRGARIEK